jgi:hypothetical protein
MEPRKKMLLLFTNSAIETRLVSFLPKAESGARKAAENSALRPLSAFHSPLLIETITDGCRNKLVNHFCTTSNYPS